MKNSLKQLSILSVSCFVMSFISEIIDWNTWLFVGAAIAFCISVGVCDRGMEKQKELERIKAEEYGDAHRNLKATESN